MEDKIKEAQEILKDLGLPSAQQNKISALTLLALCGITPDKSWANANSRSLTLSNDIMEFVNNIYGEEYKPNTRESFRKIALKPFVENNIALLNPDNPGLSTTSSKTHYAISNAALNVIRTFKTKDWDNSAKEFKKNYISQNEISEVLLRRIKIENYKSIYEDTIELGRFNVFIGANGCGKSNILEAIATAGAAVANDLNFEGLYGRGVRIARPDLTTSSFLSSLKKESINIDLYFKSDEKSDTYEMSLLPENPNDIYTRWIDTKNTSNLTNAGLKETILQIINNYKENNSATNIDKDSIISSVMKEIESKGYLIPNTSFKSLLSNFAIFDLNTKSLRGVIPADSRKTPLGINGEGLDLLIENFNSKERDILTKEATTFFDWLSSILSDKNDENKLKGLKPGRSTSTLYFTDNYMESKNRTFSAENSNEGILHVLFYLALFISAKTPSLLAIDNIETALNPRLCQRLISILSKLASERGKQVLITTHNPAILDGMNLFDDEQRLFEVYRDSAGKTKTRRIKFKKDLSDKPYKLSQMWVNGSLGAVPKNF